ncbi:alpha/beta fold hydrolase [Polymorphobacter sp.]|uniref:alpha/beta fold hydrolase n=1 Tax=Polymorphobacter sp. TaxID=1909290 RepID=UPI003F6FFDD7
MTDTLFDRGYARITEGLVHHRRLGTGTPIVMLHASPASSRTLEPLGALLTSRHDVLMPDTPGNGASSPPALPIPELADYADMLDRACDRLGLETVDLYGTHTGAHIAIEWAIARPDRVRSLILDGVALLSPDQRAEFLDHYAPPQRPDASGTQFAWAWNMIRDQMIFWPHYRKDSAHLRRDGQFEPGLLHDLTMDLLGSLETYHQPYQAVFRHDVLARLPLVTRPVLWLQGEVGVLDTDASAALARLQDHRLVTVSDLATRATAIIDFIAAQGGRA